MAPPQRPAERQQEDKNFTDVLSGTGINIEEEAQNLTRSNFYSQGPQQSFQYQNNSFSQGSGLGPYDGQTNGDGGRDGFPPVSEEEQAQRTRERSDWEASRHAQNPLWDMFLYGGNLNDKVRQTSHNEHLQDPQMGVMVNTQRHAPPPIVRVNGLEGASRVIDRGQSFLDTSAKGERLSEILKLVSLATKSRMTGLLSASARLSHERCQNSKGKIPEDWADIAVPARTTDENTDSISGPPPGISLKSMCLVYMTVSAADCSQELICR